MLLERLKALLRAGEVKVPTAIFQSDRQKTMRADIILFYVTLIAI